MVITFISHHILPALSLIPLLPTHWLPWLLTKVAPSQPQALCTLSFLCFYQKSPWLLPPGNPSHSSNVTSSGRFPDNPS